MRPGWKWILRSFNLSLPNNAFAALRELSLQDCSLSSVTSLLDYMQNSQLVSIWLSNPWVPGVGVYLQDFADFLATLAKRCSPRLLHSLSILDCEHNNLANNVTAAQISEIIEHILPFHKLKTIDIHLPYLFTIEDSLIDRLSGAWPELECLEIRPQDCLARCPDPPPITTLAGVVGLTRFPKLQRAHLNVDARGMKYSAIKEEYKINISSLRHLHLDHSMMDDPVDFAQCLTECFPKVQTFTLWRDGHSRTTGYTIDEVVRCRAMADEVKKHAWRIWGQSKPILYINSRAFQDWLS